MIFINCYIVGYNKLVTKFYLKWNVCPERAPIYNGNPYTFPLTHFVVLHYTNVMVDIFSGIRLWRNTLYVTTKYTPKFKMHTTTINNLILSPNYLNLGGFLEKYYYLRSFWLFTSLQNYWRKCEIGQKTISNICWFSFKNKKYNAWNCQFHAKAY